MSGYLVRQVLASATARLKAAGVPSPARDARRLMSEAIESIAPGPDDPIPPGVAQRFESMLAEREARVPVSHILGYREFHGRRFIVNGEVLDPRPETECLVEVALARPFSRILDLGTGSGAILLTLLAERPDATGVGTDISQDALDVAADNPLGADLSVRRRLILSDWFEKVEGRFDLIVSNPPYISDEEMIALEPEVRDHEPRIALTPGGDGLDAYRAITAGLGAHLEPGGRVLLEIGPSQAGAVCQMLAAAGLMGISVHRDLDGRDRVVKAVQIGLESGGL